MNKFLKTFKIIQVFRRRLNRVNNLVDKIDLKEKKRLNREQILYQLRENKTDTLLVQKTQKELDKLKYKRIEDIGFLITNKNNLNLLKNKLTKEIDTINKL
jgi:hypothetical protein